MLNSKEDFINCLSDIIMPLKGFCTKGCAGVKCGSTSAKYSEQVALLEAFARPLWGLAPLWGGGGSVEGFERIYLEGIINGTNPCHEEYWGEIGPHEQRLVEAAPLGLALILAPEKVWEPLNTVQRERFVRWLWRVNEVGCPDNNWNFFSVLVNLGLKNVGERYDSGKIESALSRVEKYYKGDGWYSDGATEQTDYYIGFAIHFYSLIYAKVMEKDDPVRSRIFKERAMLFAKDFIYWFSEDGSAIAFGRSLTYRFAQACFWSACVFAGIEPFSLGVMKGIIVRHMEYWLKQPIFDNGGVLSIGYAYPNLNMSEEYNAFGSPYWALKIFLILALDDEHEFFKAQPCPLPELEPLHTVKSAKTVIQRVNGYAVALTSGQWVEWNTMHVAEKYSKFAYSSKYAFCVPRTYAKLEGAGSDSMLVFVKDGMCFVRRKCIAAEVRDDGSIWSRWSPFGGVVVETLLTPTETGHVRRHTVTSDEECTAYDCSFASNGDGGTVTGGEETVIDCVPNTNLVFGNAKIKAVKYDIKCGVNHIETTVEYPREG